MRRILIILTAMISSLSISAQTEHVKFMGIPLDGTISEFSEELVKKGAKADAEYDSTHVGNIRFAGVFCGYESEIYIYYNPTSKLTYRGKACINSTSLGIISQRYYEIRKLLKDKYPSNHCWDDESGGYDSFTLIFNGNNGERIGSVDLYIRKYRDGHHPEYTLHIDYKDYMNSAVNDTQKQDDL